MNGKLFRNIILSLAAIFFLSIDSVLIINQPSLEPIGLIIWIFFQPMFIIAVLFIGKNNFDLCYKITFDSDSAIFEYADKSVRKAIAECTEITVLSNRYRFMFSDGSKYVYSTKLSPFKMNEDVDFTRFFNAKVK